MRSNDRLERIEVTESSSEVPTAIEGKDDKGLKYSRSCKKGTKVMDWRECEGRVSTWSELLLWG